MTVLGICLLLVRALPGELALLFSRLVVLIYLALRRDYRREIRDNYRAIFRVERRWFWLHNGWCLGKNLWLMGRIGTPFLSKIIDRAEVCKENIGDVEQELHTVIMVSFHYGVWELLPQVFASRGVDTAVVVSLQRDRILQKALAEIRKTTGVKLITGGQAFFSRLRNRTGVTGFMLDNTTKGKQVWVNVDGVRLRMPELPFRAGRVFNQRVVPLFAYLERGRIKVRLFGTGDEEKAGRVLLEMVRERPEEWVFWGKEDGVKN